MKPYKTLQSYINIALKFENCKNCKKQGCGFRIAFDPELDPTLDKKKLDPTIKKHGILIPLS